MSFSVWILKRVCVFYLLLLLIRRGNCLQKFTNIECINLDRNISEFTLCRMRAVKRDVTELTIRMKFLEMPTMNISMRLQLLKKASGYKPFLYDVLVSDLCEYLDKRSHPFVNIILHSIGNQSTTIQKCPFSNEISLENFGFPEKILQTLPLPFGEYGLFTTFGLNSIDRIIVKIYFVLAEF